MSKNTYFINLMMNRGNPIANLSHFLRIDSGENYHKVINLLDNNSTLNHAISQNFFPSILSFNPPYFLEKLTLEKLLLWYSLIFLKHQKSLCELEEQKNIYERLFLAGRYDEAFSLLQQIRNKFGMSEWLVDCYSLLDAFSTSSYEFALDDNAQTMFDIYKLKNRQTERQPQYIYRINHLLSKLDDQTSAYYKYKLFSELPFQHNQNTVQNWINVILSEGAYSLFDIYLAVTDCFHYYVLHPDKSQSPTFKRCLTILSQINTPICQLIFSSFNKANISYDTSSPSFRFVSWMNSAKFEEIIHAFTEDGIDLYDTFSAYRYTAIAALHTEHSFDNANNTLASTILKYVYLILKRENTAIVEDSISNLRILTRILRSFTIHKGMCIFLDVEFNVGINYLLSQQICTYNDDILTTNEFDQNVPALLPYRTLQLHQLEQNESLEPIFKAALESGIARNYYTIAWIRTQVYLLTKAQNYAAAIHLLSNSSIKDPLLKYVIHYHTVNEIRQYIQSKIQSSISISMDELCYVFLDNHFKKEQKICFLNFLDHINLTEPLNIINMPGYSQDLIDFFLARICTVEMLNSIYILFDSSDDAKDYRIKVCQHMCDRKTTYAKECQTEMEDLTKNKAMRQRLINVDKSRVSINTHSIQDAVFEAIELQVDACNETVTDVLPSQTKEKVLILNPKLDAYSCMYETYAKMFCFGPNGLDTSLSTRVRHGALINQIFRTFTENFLFYSESAGNSFFNPLFDSGKITDELKTALCSLNSDVQQKLLYFTQHTLKVFIDEPIENAVFDYSTASMNEDIGARFLVKYMMGSTLTTDSAIQLLHQMLIEKTNAYLKSIRDSYLPQLESALLDLLDAFSKSCNNCSNDRLTQQELQRLITQCKTSLQNEIKTVTGWFYLSEYEIWEDYNFSDLFDMCVEITKNLFNQSSRVCIKSNITDNHTYSGTTFRDITDIMLILLNNAMLHSGFDETPEKLQITCTTQTTEEDITFTLENNLARSVDLNILRAKIEKINNDYQNDIYKQVNTRQEGGMGLYKIMRILFDSMKVQNGFYISLNNHKIKVEIKIRKEALYCEKDIIGR